MAMARKAPEAVVFDMDGVLVDSARLHARAWKQTFDEFLAQHGDPRPFAFLDDYRRYVDGRPRYQGVESFLRSRGVTMPTGDPSEAPGMTTMTALGNLKNQAFHRLLERTSASRFLDSLCERELSKRDLNRPCPFGIDHRQLHRLPGSEARIPDAKSAVVSMLVPSDDLTTSPSSKPDFEDARDDMSWSRPSHGC